MLMKKVTLTYDKKTTIVDLDIGTPSILVPKR